MTSRRRAILGIIDQGVVALAAAGGGLLATAVLEPSQAGLAMVSIATVYVTIGVTRAFIGDVLLSHVSRYEGSTRRRMHSDAAACAALTGCVVAALLGCLWLMWPGDLFAPLIWIVPFIPALLLHDAARYTCQAGMRQDRALLIDLALVGVQAGVIVVVIATGNVTAGWLLAAWGIGATIAATGWLALTGIRLLDGRPRRWLAQTRHLSGWFTGTALIGQSQIQLITLLIPGLLGPAAFAGLRLAQLTILQPAQNLVLAMMGLLVPRSSILADNGKVAALRRQTAQLVIAGAGAGLLLVTTAGLLAEPVLTWYRDGAYLDVAALALPVSIQAAIYLMQIPFTALARGMQLARQLFGQYAVFSIVSLAGAAIGAHVGGLTATAWGLTIGSGVGLGVMAWLSLAALARMTAPQPVEAAAAT